MRRCSYDATMVRGCNATVLLHHGNPNLKYGDPLEYYSYETAVIDTRTEAKYLIAARYDVYFGEMIIQYNSNRELISFGPIIYPDDDGSYVNPGPKIEDIKDMLTRSSSALLFRTSVRLWLIGMGVFTFLH